MINITANYSFCLLLTWPVPSHNILVLLRKKNDKNLKLTVTWLCMAPWQLRYKSVTLNCLFLKYCNLLKTIISKYVLLEFNCKVCFSNFTVFYDSMLLFLVKILCNLCQSTLNLILPFITTWTSCSYQKTLDDN